jgi:hypothetical protein
MKRQLITTLNRAPMFVMTNAPADDREAYLGAGYNSVTGDLLHSKAIKFSFKEQGTETQRAEMRSVKSHSEFLHMLSISASASFGGFGGGASASMSFAQSVEITQDSFFVAAKLDVTKNVQIIQDPAFTDEAAKLLHEKEYIRFLRGYGDQYCSEATWGGQLIMLFRFYAETRNEQQSVAADMHGSFGSFGGAAQLSEKVRKFQSTETIDIQMWMTGQTKQMVHKPEEVIAFIENFPTTITDRGYVVARKFSNYNTVVGNLPKHRSPPDMAANKKRLANLADLATKLDYYIDQAGYIKDYSFQYKIEKDGLASIESELNQLKKERIEVEHTAKEIMDDPIGYNKEPEFADPKLDLPPLDDKVPIHLDVNARNKTVPGDGSDWVGQAKLAFQWLRVKFVERSFNKPNSPISLKYNCLTKLGGAGWDHEETGWVSSTTAVQGRFYAIAFKLVKPDLGQRATSTT